MTAPRAEAGSNVRDRLLSRLLGASWPFTPLLDAIQINRNAAVLDVGGGDGGLLQELKRRGHAGRRELVDALHGTDAHALPFPDGSFEVVVQLRVFAHLQEPALALAEARRVLVPGGRLVVAAHGPQHLAELLGLGLVQEPPDVPDMRAEAFKMSWTVAPSVADWLALAASYEMPVPVDSVGKGHLQLSGWLYLRD